MSILRSKHSGWTWEGRRTPFGGSGGGGGGPTSSRVEQTNIPEYARPYVETMLGATQQQLFNTRQIGATPDVTRQIGVDENNQPIMETIKGDPGYTEITGIKPYVPYSSNPSDYVAGFTPMQQEAFKRMAQQQVAPQIGQATTQAQGIAPQAYGYGSMGAGMGLEATGAGQAYQRAATTPGDVAAYMSPYMQNVVDYQKQQAIRDFQKQAPMMQAQAVGQGAFGGNRLALQQSEANRALQNQLAGIQATGTQSAFDQAQRAQQFRAQLGLQGLQTGMQGVGLGLQGVGLATQGAGLLGSLGQTQYGQETGITENILRAGTMQQQLEQQKINQAISDYATAQQYPQQQLSFMNAMLRGLPTQQSTVQGYQAPPSGISQLTGLGMTGIAGYGLGKQVGAFKKGGSVKGSDGLAELGLYNAMSKAG
jgi:hypothetical protein